MVPGLLVADLRAPRGFSVDWRAFCQAWTPIPVSFRCVREAQVAHVGSASVVVNTSRQHRCRRRIGDRKTAGDNDANRVEQADSIGDETVPGQCR
jgi:hypothetical protein